MRSGRRRRWRCSRGGDAITAELHAAIDGLYDAFAGYARLPPPRYGEAADPVAFGAHLAAKPLRQLGPTDVALFAFKAMTTWGAPDDFRHYLPRIFELLAEDGAGTWIDAQVAVGKLAYGRWQAWRSAERRAIGRYLSSL